MSLKTPEEQAYAAELRAVAHPLRMRILSLLTGAALTATEVARELEITHANASYHLRKLLVLRAVVVENEGGPGRGGSKRYRYDADREQGRPKGDRPLAAQREVYLVMADELRRRAGSLASGRGAQTDAELWVSPEAWEAATSAVGAAVLALHRAAQPRRAPDTIRTSSSVAMFPMRADG